MTARETHGFQAEVKQLLHLMIHSLYSNREIFLRELISNASDAADKLRFEAIAHPGYLAEGAQLAIHIACDPEAGTLSITDNGIGMSREDVIEQLGTIARSGTAEFIGRLSGDERQDVNLIGQFGVGFYSAFTVADRVEVVTRRAGLPADAGVRWESSGDGEFSIEPVADAPRGTRVTLQLRADAREFADEFRLRALIRKYSDHIAFPVLMKKAAAAEGEPAEEAVNTARALWTRPKAEIKDEEYQEFYRHIAHDFTAPLAWSHNRVEGKRVYTSLLYVPARAPFDLWNREKPRGLKLYVRRVFILDDAAQFLPVYLRFMRGVVDADGLALNVSREMLQQDPEVEAIRSGLTRRVLDMLDRLATEEPDRYRDFWKEFGRVLKEGPAEDFANRERIARLLRFTSTRSAGEEADRSLGDYVAGKAEGQKQVWYVTADSLAAARSSPQLEIFRQRGVEVLLLADPIDEWLVGQLGEFAGMEFRDVRRGELDPAEIGGSDAGTPPPADAGAQGELVQRLKAELGEAIEDVRTTGRLTDSPACLALGEADMGPQMRRILEASGQKLPHSRPVLEVNPTHPLVRRLAGEQDQARFADIARVLLDQATLAEGRALADPGDFLRRLNRLLAG
ncbi:molecular chaperone HtpG [Gammaproteobacteria bacterium PRO2]|nr:molecular chaperone HtpG [Gammaproteobacteria bacterium]MCL4777093.1 molecular chaperone HtpG [Gammaproteobacteria bacterium]MDL1880664.1 molecular chaperone HtpG [Gammaproteobacteria bacterium PRO2]